MARQLRRIRKRKDSPGQYSHDYYLTTLKIDGLWGYRNFSLSFDDRVNIIVGRNASGKTTILNLIVWCLTFDLEHVLSVKFSKIEFVLTSFCQKESKSVEFENEGDTLQISVNKKQIGRVVKTPIIQDSMFFSQSTGYQIRVGDFVKNQPVWNPTKFFRTELEGKVPVVWLPITRRQLKSKFMPEEEKYDYLRREPRGVNELDGRLLQLVDRFEVHYFDLKAQLSNQYREYASKVLEIFLYSKEKDTFDTSKFKELSKGLSKKEIQQVIESFENTGLLTDEIKTRLNDHLTEAKRFVTRFNKNLKPEKSTKGEYQFNSIDDFLLLPLIYRTREMVKAAEEVEKKRSELFKPVEDFSDYANKFLETKSLLINDSGQLRFYLSEVDESEPVPVYALSSGEKQIMVLLLEAFLSKKRAIIYIADEPELSLHVEWQEMLLNALQEIGLRLQIIVATHSPDIVGPYEEKIINLGRQIV